MQTKIGSRNWVEGARTGFEGLASNAVNFRLQGTAFLTSPKTAKTKEEVTHKA